MLPVVWRGLGRGRPLLRGIKPGIGLGLGLDVAHGAVGGAAGQLEPLVAQVVVGERVRARRASGGSSGSACAVLTHLVTRLGYCQVP